MKAKLTEIEKQTIIELFLKGNTPGEIASLIVRPYGTVIKYIKREGFDAASVSKQRVQDRKSKLCEECKEIKPLGQFRVNVHTEDGKNIYCKLCTTKRNQTLIKHCIDCKGKLNSNSPSNTLRCYACKVILKRKIDAEYTASHKEEKTEYDKKFTTARAERVWKDNLYKYGLTPITWQELFEAQGGRCAICNSNENSTRNKRLCVDHDHSTGKIRGLLCNNCNRAIGLLKETPSMLRSAADYLERNS